MVAFASQVYKSSGERPSDVDNYNEYLKKRAAVAAKEAGGAAARAPMTTIADDINAANTARTGEYDRRVKGAGQEATLAKAEDTRSTDIASKVREALYNRNKTVSDADTAQYQQDKKYGQTTREQMQQFGQTINTQDFSANKNAADRYDMLTAAYTKGIAEVQMLNAAKDNALKMADISRYFELLKNDLTNQLATIQSNANLDIQTMLSSIDTKAANASGIINGIFKVIGLGVSKIDW